MRPVKWSDPAPSKWRLRADRFWLTPAKRKAVTVVLPVALALGGLVLLATNPSNRDMVAGVSSAAIQAVVGHESFALTEARIVGAGWETETNVAALMAAELPASALTLDLDALRDRIEAIPAVAEASVASVGEGVLELQIVEAQPVAVWRHGENLSLIAADGGVIRQASARQDHETLPFILGEGASDAVAEGVSLWKVAQPLGDRVQALVRVGERRWTLHLDQGQVVHLPEQNPQRALRRVLALERATELLQREVALVDMRIPERPVIRLTPKAVGEVRRMRALSPDEDA